MRIAVAGATGVVGRPAVEEAARRGHEVVRLARGEGVDVTKADGLADHLHGVDVVIDCVNVIATRKKPSVEFFETTTRNLVAAGEQAGVRHHVVLSIVGIDEASGFGYYAGKVAQERTAVESGRPVSILRATQFHDFAGQMLERASLGPVALVPDMLSAPVSTAEVAAALVDVAEGDPGQRLEIGGPERIRVPEMARQVLARGGSARRVVRLPIPGAAGTAMANGALCPGAPWRTGKQTFAEWLASH